jgi:hypothetical protein
MNAAISYWDLARELNISVDEVKAHAKRICSLDGFDRTYTKVMTTSGRTYTGLTPFAANAVRMAVAAHQDPVGTLIRKTNVVFVNAEDLARILDVDVDVVDELAMRLEDDFSAIYVMAEHHDGFDALELTPYAARCVEMKVRTGGAA